MRAIILTFLILATTLSFSQTKNDDVKVNIEVSPLYEKITVRIKSESDSLIHYKVEIIDSKKNIIKSVQLPKAAKLIEYTIKILDLLPGNYTCIVFKEKKELYKKEFFKDAVYAEPQPTPVIRKSPN